MAMRATPPWFADAMAEMAAPANRPKLAFGIRSGYLVAVGFAMLAGLAAVFELSANVTIFGALVGVKLAINTLAWLCLRHNRVVMPTQTLNTIGDVVLLTIAIYYTGGAYSPLTPTYVILISVLALLTNLVVTSVVAMFTVACFATMLILTATGVLPPTHVPGAPGEVPSPGYAMTAILYCALVVGVPTFFATATVRLLRRKEAELEKRTAQLIQAATQRSQFVASMTHELRTPIHGVQGLADVIAAGVYGPVTDRQRDACASIKRSAQSLLGLVDDVLQLARAEAGKIEAHPAPVDVNLLVERVHGSVSWVIGTKQLTLDVEADPELPVVHSDERWLAHVLVNLLANAVKFTPEGGRITLRARELDAGVALEVEDTGIGIAPEDREAIFEPFRQGATGDDKGYGGVGLGLALVARLTDLLGATVELDSTVGKGSTFRVRVPLDWRGRPNTKVMRAVRPPSVL